MRGSASGVLVIVWLLIWVIQINIQVCYTGMFHLWKFIEPYIYDFVYYWTYGVHPWKATPQNRLACKFYIFNWIILIALPQCCYLYILGIRFPHFLFTVVIYFSEIVKVFNDTLKHNFWKRLLLSWEFLVMPYYGEIHMCIYHLESILSNFMSIIENSRFCVLGAEKRSCLLIKQFLR